MAESGAGELELLKRFLRLRKSRKWSQRHAGALVGVDQKAVSDWEKKLKLEVRERDAGREAPEWGVYGPAADRLKAFFRREQDYGIEVAELPPELIGEVNTVVGMVSDSEILAERLTLDEREALMRQWLARHQGPIAKYVDRCIGSWREAQDELARLEGAAHGRMSNSKKSGK